MKNKNFNSLYNKKDEDQQNTKKNQEKENIKKNQETKNTYPKKISK